MVNWKHVLDFINLVSHNIERQLKKVRRIICRHCCRNNGSHDSMPLTYASLDYFLTYTLIGYICIAMSTLGLWEVDCDVIYTTHNNMAVEQTSPS